jgi:two-component system, chemotaxis family, sensor kinase CheA
MDIDKYKKIFIQESDHYLQELDARLVRVEKDLLNQDLWSEIHGKVHSIKGMASALALEPIADLCHQMEAWCKAFQTGTPAANATAVQVLMNGTDFLGKLIAATAEDIPFEGESQLKKITDLLAQRPEDLSSDPLDESHTASCPSAINRIHVEYALIEELLARSQEIILLEKSLPPLSPQQISSGLRSWIDHYMAMLRGLHFQLTRLRLMPVQDFVSLFEKTVRDLARKHGREVRIEVTGGELQVDIGLMDRLREPFMHLLRNAIAHGIEPPDERERTGKTREGKIILEADKREDILVLKISDDGRGIDPQAITHYLRTICHMSDQEIAAMPRGELLRTILRVNFSSAPETTQLSGRGIGMDVIDRAVEYLSGSMTIQSEPLKGTTFIITLPLFLSIIYAIVFRIGDYTLSVPTSHVATIEPASQDPSQRGGVSYDLGARLGIDSRAKRPSHVLRLRQVEPGTSAPASSPARFSVDAVIGNMPLMVMASGELLARTGCFAGVGIMENGDLSILLDMEKVGKDIQELRNCGI